MARGLPKKYAKMGFKKGWAAYKRTPAYRKAHGLKPLKSSTSSATKRSPKSSTRRSNPAGGASTGAAAKIGVIIRRARTALNLTAPGWGSFDPSQTGLNTMDKLTEGVRRYSGYNLLDSTLDLNRAIPAYQGIAVSLGNDWWDRKLRNSARMSRGKIFPLLSEALPTLRARMEVPEGHPNPLFQAAVNYNKRTDGYNPADHTWRLDRVEEYAIGKGLVALYNKMVPRSWKAAANAVFPKGMNPF